VKVAAVTIVVANVVFVLWRLWAGGMFETGLERFAGWTKAHRS